MLSAPSVLSIFVFLSYYDSRYSPCDADTPHEVYTMLVSAKPRARALGCKPLMSCHARGAGGLRRRPASLHNDREALFPSPRGWSPHANLRALNRRATGFGVRPSVNEPFTQTCATSLRPQPDAHPHAKLRTGHASQIAAAGDKATGADPRWAACESSSPQDMHASKPKSREERIPLPRSHRTE